MCICMCVFHASLGNSRARDEYHENRRAHTDGIPFTGTAKFSTRTRQGRSKLTRRRSSEISVGERHSAFFPSHRTTPLRDDISNLYLRRRFIATIIIVDIAYEAFHRKRASTLRIQCNLQTRNGCIAPRDLSCVHTGDRQSRERATLRADDYCDFFFFSSDY